LVDLGLWNEQMKNMIIAHNGSIQNIPSIPNDVKAIYKTVWEISQKKILDLAADRGAYICQSQSLNVHLQSPSLGQLTSMHFYGWKKGLKTGMYYLRTRPAAQAIQFTVDQTALKSAQSLTDGTASDRKINGSAPTRAPVFQNDTAIVKGKSDLPTSTPSGSSLPSSSASISSASTPSSPGQAIETIDQSVASMSLDERTSKAAEADPEFAAALQRQRDRELEQAKLTCSLENKEACVMCSG
jgi:ribonucleoside-diphosphate reductase subunit M1